MFARTYNTMQENNINNNGDGECRRCGCHKKRVTFPPGYKFNPTDEELVEIYLKKKLMKTCLPFHEFMVTKIVETDIYKETTHPETLAGLYKLAPGEKDWYFFTPRDRKYPNGDRPNRATGVGYWKATGVDKAVRSKGVIVGYKKSLVFYIGKKPPKSEKTNWIMHEYRYNGSARKRTSPGDMKLDDWVLCRIYKKNESAKSNKEEKTAAVDTEEGESPAVSALDENQIDQGESNDEDDKQQFISGENVGRFMNLHNVEQEQQQQRPFNPYYGFVTQAPFQSRSLAGHISPHVNNLPFSEEFYDDQHVPINENNNEFQQPPPLQIVQPFDFDHPPMYLPIKSDPIPWEDDYLAQESPMNRDLIPWDNDYLIKQPQYQWEDQLQHSQQDEELYCFLGSLPECDESIDPGLVMPGR